MSNNETVVPEARSGLNRFKHEVADELGIPLNGYNGDMTAREAGKIGGTMVKKMVKEYETYNPR